jgi:serine/threonine protein kinase
MAPEVFIGEYNEKCDIWSVGVIAYMLLTGQPPFFGKNDKAITTKILKGDLKLYKHIISPEAKDFLQYLLIVDYRQRPSAE